MAINYELRSEDRLFPISKGCLARRLKTIALRAGLEPIHLHGLRHSHAAHLIDLGYSAVAIAERLGHESIEVTYRYSHLFPTAHVEMASHLDEEMKELRS